MHVFNVGMHIASTFLPIVDTVVGTAPTVVTTPSVTLTGIASSVIALGFTILSVSVPLIVSKFVNDKQAADVLSNAIENALGAIQRSIEKQPSPIISSVQGISPELSAGVQYVLDHAGKEAKRFKLTPQLIADKISAKMGLANIEVNIARNNTVITPPTEGLEGLDKVKPIRIFPPAGGV